MSFILKFSQGLSISQRIYLSFGVLTVIILVAGISSVFSVRSLEHDFSEFAVHGQALEKSSAITRKFMEIQILAKEYAVSGDEPVYEKAKKANVELTEMIEVSRGIIKDEAERAMLIEVQGLAQEYWLGFEKLHKDRIEQKEIVDGDLHQTGNILQEELVTVHEHFLKNARQNPSAHNSLELIADAVIHLLIARDHANRFVYGGDVAEKDFAAEELVRVESDLQEELKYNLPREDKLLIEDAISKISVYRNALHRYAFLTEDINRLQNEIMAEAAMKISKDLHEIEELAIAAEHKIEEHVHDQSQSAILTAIITLMVSVAFAGLISFTLGTMISRPMRQISAAMIDLSNGNLETALPVVEGKNEISQMVDTLAVFKKSMVEREEFQKQSEKEQSLKERRQDEANQLIGIFGATIKGVFERVSSASSQMSDTANTLTVNANATNEQAETLDQEAKETAQVVTLVSSAAEELNASISDILGRMENSSSISEQARDRANATSECFQELLELSREITNIVDLINEIAEQTNLLALNATIEAARAGEAGKGFAIVASEVKELATQTAKATGDIGQQVDSVLQTASRAEQFIEVINESISEIVESTSSIAHAVGEQKSATAEIARSVETVAQSSRKVEESVSVVKQSADDGYASSMTVKDAADAVISEAETLSIEVETFLGALGGQSGQEDFEIYQVNLPAVVHIGDRHFETNVQQISTASIFIETDLSQAPGTPLSIEIGQLEGGFNARVAKSEVGGTFLQLPLNHDHIQMMKKKLFALNTDKAA